MTRDPVWDGTGQRDAGLWIVWNTHSRAQTVSPEYVDSIARVIRMLDPELVAAMRRRKVLVWAVHRITDSMSARYARVRPRGWATGEWAEAEGMFRRTAWQSRGKWWRAVIVAEWAPKHRGPYVLLHELGHAAAAYGFPTKAHCDPHFRDAYLYERLNVPRGHERLAYFADRWSAGAEEVWAEAFAHVHGAAHIDREFVDAFPRCIEHVRQCVGKARRVVMRA